jgi:LysR family glycine cleavage system transcriptional activator
MRDAMIARKISLDALRVFESAARHLSFTKAAAELHMTQGAISQRIKALESALGVVLFRRLTRALELSAQGERLYGGLHAGLARIEAALGDLRTRNRVGALTLTVSASLATCWLMKRVNELSNLKPPVAVSVMADDRLLDVGIDADVALRFGRGRYRGLESQRIGGDEIFPVCSPAFLASHPVARHFGTQTALDGWRSLTRLVDSIADIDGSGCGWRSWVQAVGLGWDGGGPAVEFSHGYLALQAAAEGAGIALARKVLVSDDLARGRLVRLATTCPRVPARFSYYFVTRGEPDVRSRALAVWLKSRLAFILESEVYEQPHFKR